MTYLETYQTDFRLREHERRSDKNEAIIKKSISDTANVFIPVGRLFKTGEL